MNNETQAVMNWLNKNPFAMTAVKVNLYKYHYEDWISGFVYENAQRMLRCQVNNTQLASDMLCAALEHVDWTLVREEVTKHA